MPVRGYLVLLIPCLVLYSSSASAQTRNPHSAMPGPQATTPGAQKLPSNMQGMRLPVQAGPTTLNGQVPATPAGQAQQAPQTEAQRPAQMPPKPPRVSYVNGQLTVVADNSMMTDVLNGIRSSTGIKMEGLGGNADRVYGQFGPASPRMVIDSLLHGSHYDFIILSSLEAPDTVQRVILSPRTSNPNSTTASNTGRPLGRPPVEEDNDVVNSPDEVSDERPVPVAAPMIQQQGQPVMQQQGQPAPINPSTVQNSGQQPGTTQGVKTPEQLLEELRRLNSNQRQNQEQGPRAPQQPPDIVPR
jgi:hypothetical protein